MSQRCLLPAKSSWTFWHQGATARLSGIKLSPQTLLLEVDVVQVLALGVAAAEFDEVPVRHNEDKVNAALAKDVRWKLPQGQGPDDPHAKANLLLQVRCLVTSSPESAALNGLVK